MRIDRLYNIKSYTNTSCETRETFKRTPSRFQRSVVVIRGERVPTFRPDGVRQQLLAAGPGRRAAVDNAAAAARGGYDGDHNNTT